MNALQEQFVAEARDLVRQATDDLIALERDGASPDAIDRVFRAFHTLKGAAAVVELPAMGVMLHAAEDLLAAVRREASAMNSGIVDAALACLDQVSRWVDAFETADALPERAAQEGDAMAERLRSLLDAGSAEPARPASASRPGNEPAVPEWVTRLIAAERGAISARMPPHPTDLVAISYEPDAGCFYVGDDPLNLMRQVPGLLACRIEPREAFAPLRDLDPYACNLSMRALAAADRDSITAIFRLVPDQVRITRLPPEALSAAAPPPVGDRQALVRAILEAQCSLLRVPDRTADFAGCVGAAARAAANALRHADHARQADEVASAAADALSRHQAAPLLAALEQGLAAVGDADGPAVQGAARSADRSLRVSEAGIEALVNLAGELLVAKNALTYSARRVVDALGRDDAAVSIQRDHDAIDRLAIELHGAILRLRMVPVAQVFRAFPRLVRDVSRQLGKNVALVTRGESTEADKTIVDRLFEPVMHLVRNAVDHGIETPTQRAGAGKPGVATISVEASQVGDRLLVTVRDDGRGIDPATVRRKAAERGMLPAEELAALTDGQLTDLIFAAGFSTASEVSDLSGRGVGMDVVRTTVEQIGGKVSVDSQVGTGTTVRLDLPMSIAMSRIMVVEAAGQQFGIAMDVASETVRVAPDRITRIKANDAFELRDRVVPMVSLAELMKLPDRQRDAAAARLCVVVEAGGRIAAFEIDAIRDRLDVVLKPMQGLLAGTRGYAGTTLLGDGRVLLVLDMKEILP